MSTNFHSLRIAEVRKETADAISLLIEVPQELSTAFAFQPASSLWYCHLGSSPSSGGAELIGATRAPPVGGTTTHVSASHQ